MSIELPGSPKTHDTRPLNEQLTALNPERARDIKFAGFHTYASPGGGVIMAINQYQLRNGVQAYPHEMIEMGVQRMIANRRATEVQYNISKHGRSHASATGSLVLSGMSWDIKIVAMASDDEAWMVLGLANKKDRRNLTTVQMSLDSFNWNQEW